MGVLKSHVSGFDSSTGWHASAALAMSCRHYLHPRDTSNQELHVKKKRKKGNKKKKRKGSKIIATLPVGDPTAAAPGP